jgi:hypothetical protein
MYPSCVQVLLFAASAWSVYGYIRQRSRLTPKQAGLTSPRILAEVEMFIGCCFFAHVALFWHVISYVRNAVNAFVDGFMISYRQARAKALREAERKERGDK